MKTLLAMKCKLALLALIAMPVVAMGNVKPCCCWLGLFITCCQEKTPALKSCCSQSGKNRHADAAKKNPSAPGVGLYQAGSADCSCPILSQGDFPAALAAPNGTESVPITLALPSKRIDWAHALDLNQVWLQHPFDPGQLQWCLYLRYQSILI